MWTIPAIHGNLSALTLIHDALLERIKPGDRILYHGNYTGYSLESASCIDEILTFRRMVLAMRGMKPTDFVYLRGQQEQIWQKLLQLHYAPDPTDVLIWMLGNGLNNTLLSYGINPYDGLEACKLGSNGIAKWLNHIRETVRKHKGHAALASAQMRAAYISTSAAYPMLFVHAGLDAQNPLELQGDSFWWDGGAFDTIEYAYKPFEKVVRGYDPQHRGLYLNCITANVDDGCGFGGKLISVGLESDGNVKEILHA